MMTLSQLQALVKKCTAQNTSPFYRNLYRMESGKPYLHIDTWEQWRAIPTFEKAHLVKETLPGRTFAPWSNIDTILASSGTSGSPPVFSPWVLNDGYGYRLHYHDFKRSVLSSMPTPFQQNWILGRINPWGNLVVLDPKRCRASVRLAQAAGVDSMFLILHHMPLVAEEMKCLGMNNDIRFIEIAGETCSQSLFAYMRESFPNATITSIYGSSDVETSPIGVPCRPMTGAEPLEVYHPRDCFYLEIANPDTLAPLPIEPGVEGDLLITTDAGSDATFPLVRYRIGDTVRVVERACQAHGAWSFEVLGRTGMDFLKVPGGILRADEVERTLRILKLPDRFELHRYERRTPRGLKTEVVMHIAVSADSDTEKLATDIAKNLRVSTKYTYADGVRDGLYLPLSCVPLSTAQRVGKSVRMIQH